MTRIMKEKAPVDDQIRLDGAGSQEACAWLAPPENEEPLPDEHFRIALGMRLNVRRPLHDSLIRDGCRLECLRELKNCCISENFEMR